MITAENLCKASLDFIYISVKFVSGDNPYWEIYSADPLEVDEDLSVAKLYYDTFDLEIYGADMKNVVDINLCDWLEVNEDEIMKYEPKKLLSEIFHLIADEINESVTFNEILVSYFDKQEKF